MKDSGNSGSVTMAAAPLTKVAKVIMGQSPPGETYNEDGEGLPLLNGPTEFGSTSPDCTQFTTDSQRECEAGDLIFCVRGSTTGRMNWADIKYSLGRGVCGISGETPAETRFIRYCIEDKLHALLQLAGGGTFPNLTKDDIEEFEIPWPENRMRIAGILSAYDELIENSQRRIRILETMARALYYEWFVHFRFPGHEKLPRVASSLGDIPRGWEVRTVEELVMRIPVGKKYAQKTVNVKGTVPVLDQGKSGIIGYHDDEPGVVASESSPVVVFANHTCYQRLVHFPFSAIQNMLPFVPSPSLPRNIYWLYQATNGLVVFNDYKGHWPEFAAKNLVVPPANVCQHFGDFVIPLSHQILKQERAIENLRRTRDLLLPRLLSGQMKLG